jgi:outer membrane protein assembly factor BamE (lipoprotein component of BamABCDE complex)
MTSVSVVTILSQQMLSRLRHVFGLCLCCFALSACESKISSHGHAIDEAGLNEIKIGETTRIDLLASLGQPSFEGAFNSGKLYYVSQLMVEPAGGKKETKTRQLFAFTIDENNVVTAVDLIDESNGKTVLHLDEKTPTPGDNFGVIDQIFSNLKRRRNAD